MLFCQHSSNDSGLFVGKLETDVLGHDVVNEYIPAQGSSFKNVTFVIIDFNKHEAWLLDMNGFISMLFDIMDPHINLI